MSTPVHAALACADFICPSLITYWFTLIEGRDNKWLAGWGGGGERWRGRVGARAVKIGCGCWRYSQSPKSTAVYLHVTHLCLCSWIHKGSLTPRCLQFICIGQCTLALHEWRDMGREASYISWRAFLECENGWLTDTNNVIIIGRSGMFCTCAGMQVGGI